MSNKFSYRRVERTTDPVTQVRTANGKGYFDLISHRNKNGKAIFISNKFGEGRVKITLDKVPALIEALNTLKTRGVNMSVDEVEFSR